VDQPRIVLVKFKNIESKLKLLAVRDVLRERGIKIASDLTNWKQKKLKQLARKGKRGYFRSGTLCIREEKLDDSQNTRIFKKASRRIETKQQYSPACIVTSAASLNTGYE
jgi:hypothetical protein